MNNIAIIATKEIQEGLRNRWVLATTLLLAALALSMTFLGSAPTGSSVAASKLDVVIVSLSSLTIFLIPLIALLISHDAIVGEMERGTMLLLLSYPLSRIQVVLGKFIGQLAILAFATLFGYGVAALALAATGTGVDAASWISFLKLIGSSILLGAVFIAIGFLASTLVRERSTAAGIAIGVWLFFVLIYDAALLVFDQGQTIGSAALNALLLLNPADSYRLLNFGTGQAGALTGMGGMAGNATLSAPALALALGLWAVLPLSLSMLVFSRKEL
ncbi:ABC transporter permease [Brucella melitensis]|uniref:Membrane protein nosy n=1 Tax=Brucella melitensis biotype 1 (strain ATCC 23456 / CCUG 17765 / NCTC 10094 / 16M) TaxID=224914 RepID=Q8YBD0_BRUME|nr:MULTISPECIES: ABC transporter permease [Brucella]EPZ76458.1 NosY permease [Brucella melitensis ADMAS-G1]AAL54212.1 membrane protein nosy precursor [Brucella melitensis bv. 1 str. 16M]AIJ88290.1 ABC-2 transporter family protein [Brucella melitensis bv. 1 str. 16M]AVM32102.1 ABC transporter permease [Brucella melitensis]EEW87148.1 nitrous-oxide reductase [Brucella melitensis bv. 1 str. 16M]